MSLYLCIDGGGTKTAATVAHVVDDKVIKQSRGEAGPSNLTFGLDNCLIATRQAITEALERIDPDLAEAFTAGKVVFTRAWAGYAGCARPADFATLRPPLSRLIPCSALVLSSDGELLTSPLFSSTCSSCITLICGTGSLALLWRRTDGEVRNEGRSGGWGAVLGDEGSGWSMGREGIKSVLTYTANRQPLLPWHQAILDHLEVSDPDLLLSAATRLADTAPPGPAESERKKRIAGCARIVVGAEGDEAERILDKVAKEVVDVIRPLARRLDGDLKDTILSVTGGLGGSQFWARVEEIMEREGWDWHSVCYLADPAEDGLRSLLQKDTLVL